MLRNYFKIAWRNLQKNRAYSAINILGLSIGMAVALLIGLWIADELNFNKSFKNYDRLVKVMENSTHGSNTTTSNTLPIPLAIAMRTKYQQDIRAVALTSWIGGHSLAVGDKMLSEQGVYVEPQFMDMFSVRLTEGAPGALNDMTSIVINQSLAKALFGAADPVGRILKVDNRDNMKVTGVFEDFPRNSEFWYVDYLMPWTMFLATNYWARQSYEYWDNNSFRIFAQLQDHADLDRVAAKVKPLLTGHDRRDKPEVLLHPMSKWNLYNDFKGGVNTGGAIQFVWMFGIIGVFVLLLACINFMNLSTARSERRAKEVGIRKAIGSLRRQLIGQFLGESLLITFLSLVLSLALLRLALPWFSQVAGKRIGIPWGNPPFWLLLLGFAIFTGLLAGSYPAFYLSSFNSIKALKGGFKAGRMASLPRKILVVLQFTVSVSLIIGTLVIFQQIKYARNRPMGYDRDGLITVFMTTDDLYRHYDLIRRDLINGGAVVNMGLSGAPTTELYSRQSGFDWPGKDPNFEPSMGVDAVSYDFGNTVGWQFEEGRNFSRDFATDSMGLVLNEAAVRYMGLRHPVGTIVQNRNTNFHDNHFHVIGVIKDMIMESPYAPVTPTVFTMDSATNNMSIMTLKMNQQQSTAKNLARIEPIFKKYNPGAPFNFSFNDDVYAQKFELEQRVGNLATVFAVFAVFISCLGLFGLASFMAEQRTKEIGIRKVLGASVMNLWGILSREFLLLVLLSFFIAAPFSYYVMHRWLEHYDYRTTISVWIFVVTMGMALLITLLTVSVQSIRASLANPVRSLRTE